jgi:transcriptional regulator with XRE-family HTH domain
VANTKPRTDAQRLIISYHRRAPLASNTSQLVKFLYHQLELHQITYQALEKRSGLSSGALSAWFRGMTEPRTGNLEAALNAIGYRLEPVPLRKTPVQSGTSAQKAAWDDIAGLREALAQKSDHLPKLDGAE